MRLSNPDIIYTWNIKELYRAFLETTAESERDLKKELDLVKNGFEMKVPIYMLTDDVITLDYKKQEARLPYFGRHTMTTYKDELEKRETLMRRIIIEELDEEEMAEPEEEDT